MCFVGCTNLGLGRDGVPVSSTEGELPAADTSQNLLRCVLRTVRERSETGGGRREQREENISECFIQISNQRDYFNICVTFSEVLQQHVIQKQSLIILTSIMLN